MVSLRRRRLLGLWCGPNGYVTPLPFLTVEEMITGIPNPDYNPMSVKQSDEEVSRALDKPLKPRKLHRRKQIQNQEPCLMRGVYCKNMKWQAAIKVEKRQIHLGTFSSQEEAARLYDRAAYLCGREPNFELLEEDKRQLKQQSWEEFLACTRRTITNKRPKRRLELD